MYQVGQWWLPEADKYFSAILTRTPKGFELDHLEEALRFVDKFDYAVDVGAHVGTWTLKMAEHFKQVMAFEPAMDTFECLTKNVEGRSNITLCPTALGSYAGFCNVRDDETRPGNTGARIVVGYKNAPGSMLMAPLDQYHLRELDFLKIDVEGHEIHVLMGAAATIRFLKPVIMVECKYFNPPRYGGPEMVKRYLHGLEYREMGGIRNDRVFKYRFGA